MPKSVDVLLVALSSPIHEVEVEKEFQFDIINDPVGFSHQHDIRKMPNGHYTLYDNGTIETDLCGLCSLCGMKFKVE